MSSPDIVPGNSQRTNVLDIDMSLPRLGLSVAAPVIADPAMHGADSLVAKINGHGIRNIIPEPFDIPDHIGNISWGAMLGITAAIAAAEAWIRFNDRVLNREPSLRSTRLIATTAGAITGIVGNIAGEIFLSKPGISPSYLDIAWGTGAAILSSQLLQYETTTPDEQDPPQ